MIKVKCNVCGVIVRIDENNYAQGTTIISCPRCSNLIEVEIPGKPADKQAEPEPQICSDPAQTANSGEKAKQDQKDSAEPTKPVKKKRKPPTNPRPKKTDSITEAIGELLNEPEANSKIQPVSQPIPEPPQFPGYSDSSAGSGGSTTNNSGCGYFLLIIIGILIVVGIIWAFRSCGNSGNTVEVYNVDTTIMEEEPAEEVVEVPEETVIIDSVIDTTLYVEEESMVYGMGFHAGKNSFRGKMIHTNGDRYPFSLSFFIIPSTGEIEDILYKNLNYGTTLRLQCQYYHESGVKFFGNDGDKEFTLSFSGENPYTGDAWWGDLHQDIELTLE